ncbi:MAG TPA: GAF domain-containing sensor histidine kinase [Patescibacteria group bacterium]
MDKNKLENHTLEKIYDSSLRFLAPLSLYETYTSIIEEALKLTGAEYGTIFIKQRNKFERIYSTVPPGNQIQPRKRGFIYKAFHNKKITVLTNQQFKSAHPEFQNTTTKSVVIIPLTFKNKSIGVISLDSKSNRQFTPKKLEILLVFSSFAYLAIQKTQLYSATKDALDARDIFISIVAHNLRTPLTTVVGYTDLIHKKLSLGKVPKKEWAQIVKNETALLNAVINNILETNQVKTGRYQYKLMQQDMCNIVDKSVRNFKKCYPKHTIKLNNKLDPHNCYVIGDNNKLEQALDHILANSAQFSPPTNPINLNVSAKNHSILVSIKDRGKGIPKKDLSHIFKQFYRGSNSKTESMGIGLFLTKKILEKHRGKIEVHSIPTKGTTVKITLPRVNYPNV